MHQGIKTRAGQIHPGFTGRIIETEMNYLFQTSDTGSPYEYERLEEIIAPDALDQILNWLNGVLVQ